MDRASSQITSPNVHIFTISQQTLVAKFKMISPGLANQVWPMCFQQLILEFSFLDVATNVYGWLFQLPQGQTPNRRRLFTTESADTTHLESYWKVIHHHLLKLRELRKQDFNFGDTQRNAFVDQFTWRNIHSKAGYGWIVCSQVAKYYQFLHSLGSTEELPTTLYLGWVLIKRKDSTPKRTRFEEPENLKMKGNFN